MMEVVGRLTPGRRRRGLDVEGPEEDIGGREGRITGDDGVGSEEGGGWEA